MKTKTQTSTKAPVSSETRQIVGFQKRETEKAVLIAVGYINYAADTVRTFDLWFPKSQVVGKMGTDITGRSGKAEIFEIKTWMADQKERELKACIPNTMFVNAWVADMVEGL